MKIRPLTFLILILLSLCGCSGTAVTADSPSSLPVEITEKTITVPGLEKDYRLLFLSDLHIIAPDDPDVNDEKKEEVAARRDTLFVREGVLSAALWEEIAPALDNFDADLILLGGDLVDYCSFANIDILKKGLDRIETPLIYVRADHDTETWYTDAHMTKEDSLKLHDSLKDLGASNDDIIVHDLEGLRVIGINNSTSFFTPGGAADFNALLSENIPTVVVTHVPLKPLEDTGLSELSKQAWQDRALLWGNDCYHVPDALTAEAYARLYRDDSPAFLLLSGHLHFPYEGPLSKSATQIVNAPAYEGHITLITVTGN